VRSIFSYAICEIPATRSVYFLSEKVPIFYPEKFPFFIRKSAHFLSEKVPIFYPKKCSFFIRKSAHFLSEKVPIFSFLKSQKIIILVEILGLLRGINVLF
jgi:hypothetical protein